MQPTDIQLRGKAGITTIARGCAAWASSGERIGSIPVAVVEPVSHVSNRALVVAAQDIVAGKTGGGWTIGGGGGPVLLKAGAAIAMGDTLAIADIQGRWRPAVATDQWVPYMAAESAATDGVFMAVPHINLPYRSDVLTGTGAMENIAHGLRRVPRLVLCSLVATNGVLASLNIAFTEGAHTNTLCKVQMTLGVKYRIEVFL